MDSPWVDTNSQDSQDSPRPGYIFSALRAKKHRVNQAHFAPRRPKAKKNIDLFFRASSFFWPIPVIEDKSKQALAKMAL